MSRGRNYREFLGARRDPIDTRDYVFRGAPAAALVKRGVIAMPLFVDRRDECGPIYDQGQEPSCVGMAIAGAASRHYKAKGLVASGRWSYHFAQQNDRFPDAEGGSSVMAGLIGWDKEGAAPEELCPYVANAPNYAVFLNTLVHRVADSYPLQRYERLRGWTETCLAIKTHGIVVITWNIGEAWDNPGPNTIIEMKPGDQYWGWHAMDGVGYYNGDSPYIIMRNSWGDWAQKGYCPVSRLEFERNAKDVWLPIAGPKRKRLGLYHRVLQAFRAAARSWGNGVDWDM